MIVMLRRLSGASMYYGSDRGLLERSEIPSSIHPVLGLVSKVSIFKEVLGT